MLVFLSCYMHVAYSWHTDMYYTHTSLCRWSWLSALHVRPAAVFAAAGCSSTDGWRPRWCSWRDFAGWLCRLSTLPGGLRDGLSPRWSGCNGPFSRWFWGNMFNQRHLWPGVGWGRTNGALRRVKWAVVARYCSLIRSAHSGLHCNLIYFITGPLIRSRSPHWLVCIYRLVNFGHGKTNHCYSRALILGWQGR